jgi:hypothetical protein
LPRVSTRIGSHIHYLGGHHSTTVSIGSQRNRRCAVFNVHNGYPGSTLIFHLGEYSLIGANANSRRTCQLAAIDGAKKLKSSNRIRSRNLQPGCIRQKTGHRKAHLAPKKTRSSLWIVSKANVGTQLALYRLRVYPTNELGLFAKETSYAPRMIADCDMTRVMN